MKLLLLHTISLRNMLRAFLVSNSANDMKLLLLKLGEFPEDVREKKKKGARLSPQRHEEGEEEDYLWLILVLKG